MTLYKFNFDTNEMLKISSIFIERKTEGKLEIIRERFFLRNSREPFEKFKNLEPICNPITAPCQRTYGEWGGPMPMLCNGEG